MMNRLFLAVPAVMLAGCGGSAGDSAVSVAPVAAAVGAADARVQLEASAKSIADAQAALNAAQYAQVQVALKEIDRKRAEVSEALDEIDRQNLALMSAKAQLERDKENLQRQKDLLATGLIAALLAAFAQSSRWFTFRLDRRLKKLEIEERELALQERRAKSLQTVSIRSTGDTGDG